MLVYPLIYRGIFRIDDKSRVLFNSMDSGQCMETCLKYNEAQAPLFRDPVELRGLVTWAINTTTNPDTNTKYRDIVSSGAFWLPMR